MKNRLPRFIPFVFAALVPVVGCGQSPTAPRITPPTLAADEFELSGVVTDGNGDDGSPLPGVDLLVSASAAAQDMGPQSRSATTDEDGHFSVTVPGGSWNVALSKPGYIDRTIVLSVDGNTTMNFSMLKLEAAKARAVRR